MILQKLRFKNFLSSGNAFIEIDLTKYRNSVIGGKNGMGKCLHPLTLIDIQLDDDIRKEFESFIKK